MHQHGPWINVIPGDNRKSKWPDLNQGSFLKQTTCHVYYPQIWVCLMFPCDQIQIMRFLQDIKVHRDNVSDIFFFSRYHTRRRLALIKAVEARFLHWYVKRPRWLPPLVFSSTATPSHCQRHKEYLVINTSPISKQEISWNRHLHFDWKSSVPHTLLPV